MNGKERSVTVSESSDGDEIAWTLTKVRGAHELLVHLPGVALGAFSPQRWRDKTLAGVEVHRLYLGARDGMLVRADGLAGEALAAYELIRDVARELRVDMKNVICVGHSYAGSCAILMGLWLEAGRIIVGAPAVRLGTWAAGLKARELDEAGRELFGYLIGLSGIEQVDDNVYRLDDLIPSAVRAARYPGQIAVLVSRLDAVFAECLWLRNEIAFGGILDCQLTLSDYVGHQAVEQVYYRYLKSLLLPGPRP